MLKIMLNKYVRCWYMKNLFILNGLLEENEFYNCASHKKQKERSFDWLT